MYYWRTESSLRFEIPAWIWLAASIVRPEINVGAEVEDFGGGRGINGVEIESIGDCDVGSVARVETSTVKTNLVGENWAVENECFIAIMRCEIVNGMANTSVDITIGN